MSHGYPDYEGDKSGLYLKPEWAAKEGIDKNLVVQAINVAIGGNTDGTYVVPAGKTFYINGMSFYSFASAPADAELNQIGRAILYVAAIFAAAIGGNGGGSLIFPKPIVIGTGVTVTYRVGNVSDHVVNHGMTLFGYEVLT
jgi:hypothetical protein